MVNTKKYNTSYYERNREACIQRTKDRLKDLEKRKAQQLAVIKHRAIKKNFEFNITVADLDWPTHCPILEVPLTWDGDRWDSPSIDRVDSSKGYVKGNVRIISTLANAMKAHATNEQLATFAKNIMSYVS